jgi:DNA-binding transcriptional LysR family regulator
MELRHLRYFLTIAQTENVRQASERLHITQPAVSRQLQDLEQELGVELFDRLPRKLRLNAAGRIYEAEVKRILAELATAGERARRVAAGEAGLLKLGFVEITAWEGIVPDTFRAFTSIHPSVRVELSPGSTTEQLRMLQSGQLDGCFVYPFDELQDQFASYEVRSGNVVLAMPLHWAGRFGNTMRARDLFEVPFVGFPRDVHPAYYDRVTFACQAAGLSPNLVQHGSHEGALLSLVSAGVGVAIVNDANLDRPPARVAFAPIEDISVPLKLHFVHRPDSSNRALQHFIDVVAACVGERIDCG